MPRIEKTKRVIIADFSKGLYQTSNPLMLPAGFATDLNNVNFQDAPSLSTRLGRQAFDAEDPADTGKGLFTYRTQAGRYFLIRALGSTGNLDYWDGDSWENMGSMTAAVPVYGVAFPSKDWFIFGDGTLMKYLDGTTLSTLQNAPALLCLEVHLNKLWGVHELTKIEYSATGNPEDWSTANDYGYIMVDNAAGEPVTAIKSHRGYLFVWTQNTMFIVYGDSPLNFSLVQVPEGKGCYSHFSVVEIDGLLYWFGPDGVIQYQYGARPRVVSRNRIDDIIDDVDINQTDEICAGTDGIQYRLSLPGVSQDYEVVFDPRWNNGAGAFTKNDDETYSRYLFWGRV